MSLTTANVDVKDDWVGTKDTELGGLMIRGNKLTVQGCELLYGSIEQSTKRDLCPASLAGVLLHYIVLFGPSWSYTY